MSEDGFREERFESQLIDFMLVFPPDVLPLRLGRPRCSFSSCSARASLRRPRGTLTETPSVLRALSPLASGPTHFLATAYTQSFGPFSVAPITIEALSFDASANATSDVVRFAIQ